MARLEDLRADTAISGILPEQLVTVVNVAWMGSEAVELTYKDAGGRVANQLLFRADEERLAVVEAGRPWSFDGEGAQFRLVAEAHRIRLAHLFDPLLAVHSSKVEPLPHQITAVYESMLPRQPLRFLLADDPGAGKTIMAGLLIKEMIVRGDLQRCLIVCPGSLAEQWQDELSRRFQLPFDILTNDMLESARSGNAFLERNLLIARLDKLSRSEDVQAKLQSSDCRWDLVVCDEAHKLSASYYGNEPKYTKRYNLGKLLSGLTRNLLLMTATPHNGKERDFQLFLALLDPDRFEGRFREEAHLQADASDMMRRMVKEKLLKFDGRPLFPERIAHTVPYALSSPEDELYQAVSEYVRQEFNRAEALQNDKRAGTVGFALTTLQRRLASSPEAIYQSLRRRRERLEKRLEELREQQRGVLDTAAFLGGGRLLDADDLEDLDEAPEDEVEAAEEEVLDQATAARTMDELRAELDTLRRLEAMALRLRQSGEDRKWKELSGLLAEVFTPAGIMAIRKQVAEDEETYAADPDPRPKGGPQQKLVIFTEHRDTLNYLQNRIETLLGHAEAVVRIHGGMGRQERLDAQDFFRNDPRAKVLLATDAAGEGINLQRAHLMVNYDLPWNPNRLEQRFGRIHRIGQTEVCHLWNLVADETREGHVYSTLLAKIEEARKALGSQVFDVLGQLQFQGKSLRDLLLEAIRYGERPEVRDYLQRQVADATDLEQVRSLMIDQALVPELMNSARVERVREAMERAEAQRLQPHFVESFFKEALGQLGGTMYRREAGRYEVTHVPAPLRNQERRTGLSGAVVPRYERIAFDKAYTELEGQVRAELMTPGHPLLDATLGLILDRHRDLLRRGTVLVDETDSGETPRVLFFLEHAVQDASPAAGGGQRVISRRMLYVELTPEGDPRHLRYAPYLDYRPLAGGEPSPAAILARPECAWITAELERRAQGHAVARLVPEHLTEVRERRQDWNRRTKAAVQDRLSKEIAWWDKRAAELQAQEREGKPNARLNSQEARRRADELQQRLRRRLDQLNMEDQVSALPPVIMGGAVVVPLGLLARLLPTTTEAWRDVAARISALGDVDRLAVAAAAREIVMAAERGLGHEPRDVELEKIGYDVESRDPRTGALRFIEVKGRVSGAASITVTRNEILTSLNTPDKYILAIVEFLPGGEHRLHYLRQPFQARPDFGATSVNYDMAELLSRATGPQ